MEKAGFNYENIYSSYSWHPLTQVRFLRTVFCYMGKPFMQHFRCTW